MIFYPMAAQKVITHRSRAYLNTAKDQPCVRCLHLLNHHNDVTTVAAHYHGPRKFAYGGGLGRKTADIVTAHLCFECHHLFDAGKLSDGGWISETERSEEFLHWVMMTILHNISEGVIKA